MNEALTFADLQDTGNAQSQLVYLAIARHADWETGECYVAVKRLAVMAKCSEKTCRRHLDRLETDTLIEREMRKRQDGGRAADLIRMVGYKIWFETNRKGGQVNKPKTIPKYDTPPGQPDQAPLDTSCPGPLVNKVTRLNNVTKNKKEEKRISDFEKGSSRQVRDTDCPLELQIAQSVLAGHFPIEDVIASRRARVDAYLVQLRAEAVT